MTFHIDPIPGAVHTETVRPQAATVYLLWDGDELLSASESEARITTIRDDFRWYHHNLHITTTLVTPAGSVTR